MDIHIRDINSICYGMIDNRICKLTVCGSKVDHIEGEYLNDKNKDAHILGNPENSRRFAVQYYVRKDNDDNIYPFNGCNLFDSKEALINYLLK